MKGLLLFLLLGLLSPRGFSQTPPKPPALCTIEGQVVADPDGKPIRKVEIQISGTSEDNENHSYGAVTDAAGRFEIEKVTPGRYRVTLRHAGFVRSTRRTDRMAWTQTSLTIDPGQEVRKLVFHMQPAAVILGKVTDQDGDPQQGSVIAVFRSRPNPRRAQGAQGHATTNDLGEFRVGGLPPGKYVVMAIPPFHERLALDHADQEGKPRAVLALTYYPGTIDRQQAAPIELHAGDEVPVTIELVSTHSYHIRGSVNLPVPETGDPAVVLEPLDWARSLNPYPSSHPGEIDKNGKFDISGVLPGSYVAVMYINEDGSPKVVARSATFEVTDGDVERLHLAPISPAQIYGRFRMDDNSQIDWTKLNVWLDPGDDLANRSPFARFDSENSTVKADGSFAMKQVLPGQYRLAVNSGEPAMRDLYLKSVSVGGKDTVENGFTVAGGSYSLEVVISPKGAAIEGVVTDSKDQPVPDAQVVAVPDATLRARSDAYHQSTTDQHGRFSMHGLIPGEYSLLAFENLEDDYRDPDFLKAFESRVQSVKVAEGERAKTALKVIASPE